jgi:glycosyl hydrolase family 32
VLRLPDHWIWDSWLAVGDGGEHHLFFLRAPRALPDPRQRHDRASIGHARSRDLRRWELEADALVHGEPGAWDDLAVWTGSVARAPDGGWRLFYTGRSHADQGRVQRIGLAASDDLITWTRVGGGPLLEADPRVYEKLEVGAWPDEAWRDPYVLEDPGGDGWHMLITARAVGAGRNDDGVVAHAWSTDLLRWEVGAPLCRPGAGFGQLEVLQNKRIDGRDVLVFTCHPQETTAQRRAASGDFCTWSVPSPGPLGPWDVSRARPFTADPHLFAAPLVQRRDGSWVILGFRNLEHLGKDGFAIYEPIPVTLDADGYLVAR